MSLQHLTPRAEHERDDMTTELPTTPASELIDELLLDIDGLVRDRSRVVDALLDIRLLAASDDRLQAAVDDALASVPGKSLVPSEWYRDTLCGLARLVSSEVAPVG